MQHVRVVNIAKPKPVVIRDLNVCLVLHQVKHLLTINKVITPPKGHINALASMKHRHRHWHRTRHEHGHVDYIDAWTNVFWHQNNKFKHSWLIYFKNNTVYNFPNWFLQWWNFFGPTSQIYLEQVQQGFEQFNRMFNNQESRIPADLMYFSSFSLSWIFSWQYRYGKT